MTNVSKVKTGSPDYKHASQELTQLISKLNKKTASVFINELFTESEKIMITKRFAAALLFNNNFSTYRTAIGREIVIKEKCCCESFCDHYFFRFSKKLIYKYGSRLFVKFRDELR